MSRNRNHHSVLRQWEILKHLPRRRPGRTVSDLVEVLLASGFTVSPRTVQRDLEELSLVLPLVVADTAKPYRWSWMEDAPVLDVAGLACDEALALCLVEAYLPQLMPRSLYRAMDGLFAMARRKLDDAPGGVVATGGWLSRVHLHPPALPLVPPRVDEEVQAAVHDALMGGRCLEVDYHRAGAEQGKRMLLHPLGLVFRPPTSYLVATIGDYQDPRLLALHRMASPCLLEQPARMDEAFDLREWIARGGLEFLPGGRSGLLTLRLRLRAWLAHNLAETPLAEGQQLEELPDGRFELTAPMTYSWQLRWWLLSVSPAAEVLEPGWLREQMHNDLQLALRPYASETDGGEAPEHG